MGGRAFCTIKSNLKTIPQRVDQPLSDFPKGTLILSADG